MILSSRFRATYRLQLHRGFKFNDALKLLDYFDQLGISHLYLSPIFEARKGSSHGYDGVDPTKVSVERGGEHGLIRLLKHIELKHYTGGGLNGVILDIVPNHLAVSCENPFWRDVLELGPASKYRRVFDVRGDKIVLPFLGRPFEDVLHDGELRAHFHPRLGLVIQYYDEYFPLQPASWTRLLDFASGAREKRPRAAKTVTRPLKVPPKGESFADEWHKTKADFLQEMKSGRMAAELNRRLHGLPVETVREILREQFYCLEEWRTGVKKLNYRRFFDINHLIGIRVQDAEVFEWQHRKIFDLMKVSSAVQGLRIDHIDGLLNPRQYLQSLRAHCDSVWVEKILCDDEALSYDWPVRGSTGYEFSNTVTNLFVDQRGHHKIHDFYLREMNQRWRLFSDCVYSSKKDVMQMLFSGELEALAADIHAYGTQHEGRLPFATAELKNALEEFTVCLKVYRIYFQLHEETGDIGQDDRKWLLEALEEAKRRGQVISQEALQWLATFFSENREISRAKRDLMGRWQQLSGPVMAKGLEDTALYRYFPLISLNVVGGQPDMSYNTAIEFHIFNSERLKTRPSTMNTTTTHDTKVNSDVRARMHVLSEMPDAWAEAVGRWTKINSEMRVMHNGLQVPSLNFEYFVYQVLIGAWPIDGKITVNFKKRMKEYFLKAAKEAKLETNWIAPDLAYEEKLMKFLESILDERKNRKFLKEFADFASTIGYFGAFNSLGEVALKILSPGIPDIYQGTETWSLHLTDPDNRRPVNYGLLLKYAKRAREAERAKKPVLTPKILHDWRNGEVKFVLTRELLRLRQRYPMLFEKGRYIPLEIRGSKTDNAVGFIRHFEGKWVLVLVPRFLTKDLRKNGLGIAGEFWADTKASLPLDAPTVWWNPLNGTVHELKNGHDIQLREVFSGLPVLVLTAEI